jgi:hypothetical protein
MEPFLGLSSPLLGGIRDQDFCDVEHVSFLSPRAEFAGYRRLFVTVYAILSCVLAGELPYGIPMVWFLNPDAGPKALVCLP